MATIAVPESLNFLANPAHRAAFKGVGNAEGLPKDFTIDEARQFHLATLSALKLKTDYWCLLHDLWSAIWAPLVAGLPVVPFGTALWDESAGEVVTVWDDQLLCASHRTSESTMIWTAVGLDPVVRGSVRLYMAVEDIGSDENTEWLNATPPSGWKFVADGDEAPDYAPFWQAEIPVTPGSTAIALDAAMALARTAISPFLPTAL